MKPSCRKFVWKRENLNRRLCSKVNALAKDSQHSVQDYCNAWCQCGHLKGVGQLNLKLLELIQRCASDDMLQRSPRIYFTSHIKGDRGCRGSPIRSALAHQHQLAFLHKQVCRVSHSIMFSNGVLGPVQALQSWTGRELCQKSLQVQEAKAEAASCPVHLQASNALAFFEAKT